MLDKDGRILHHLQQRCIKALWRFPMHLRLSPPHCSVNFERISSAEARPTVFRRTEEYRHQCADTARCEAIYERDEERMRQEYAARDVPDPRPPLSVAAEFQCGACGFVRTAVVLRPCDVCGCGTFTVLAIILGNARVELPSPQQSIVVDPGMPPDMWELRTKTEAVRVRDGRIVGHVKRGDAES